MLNLIALTFASGKVFFYGLFITQLASNVNVSSERRVILFLLNVTTLLGIVAVVLSATPFPAWVYGIWICMVLAVRIFRNRDGNGNRRVSLVLMGTSVLVFALMLVAESRYWMSPELHLPATKAIYVVGDSISIGADAQELNWPELLGAQLGATAHNYSFGGAKVRSALPNAKRVGDEPALIILEIGGNDILAGTDEDVYEQGLEELMRVVCTPEHDVVMFELPLPPFHNRYGRIQRALANEYGVTLIPKRLFAEVLAVPGATIDGLHLSHSGHRLMANRVAALFAHNAKDATDRT